jgi:hypothetical protein
LTVPAWLGLTPVHDNGPFVVRLGTGLAFVAIAFVAALIASRQPNNALWYVLSLNSVLTITSAVCDSFSTGALDRGTHALAPRVAASISNVAGGPVGLLFLALVLLLFPDGKPSSRRWRRVVVFAAGWSVLYTLSDLLIPGVMEDITTKRPVTNVFGVRELAPLRELVSGPGFFVVLVLVVLGAVSVGFRYRSATAMQRQQIKFVFLAAMIVSVVFIGGPVYFWRPIAPAWAWSVAFMVAVMSLPATLGAAILRYRLYDIDRIISRTASYIVVTALLGGVFTLIVVAPSAALGSHARVPAWTVAIATLAVAVLFQPVRRRVQQAIDRRFNRARYDAVQTVEEFTARLKDQIDMDALSTELAEVITRTVQPRHVRLWLAP